MCSSLKSHIPVSDHDSSSKRATPRGIETIASLTATSRSPLAICSKAPLATPSCHPFAVSLESAPDAG